MKRSASGFCTEPKCHGLCCEHIYAIYSSSMVVRYVIPIFRLIGSVLGHDRTKSQLKTLVEEILHKIRHFEDGFAKHIAASENVKKRAKPE
jgi:hypothetical protein